MSKQLTQPQWERLNAWVDGELTGSDAAEIARLVESDPIWRAAHDDLRSLDRLLDNWDTPPIPQGLPDQIRQYVRSQTPGPRSLRWLGPVAAAAAVLIVVLLAETGQAPHRPATLVEAGQTVPIEFVQGTADLFAQPDGPVAGNVEMILAGDLRRQLLADTPLPEPTGSTRWQRLSHEQRQRARQRALAFLQLSPQRQRDVLAQYEQSAALAPAADQEALRGQAQWLRLVVESFTPEQRRELLELSPAERAKAFLDQQHKLMGR